MPTLNNTTTIPMVTKTCSSCKETMPVSAFPKNPTDKSGYRSDCKNCRNAKRRGKTSKRKDLSVYYKSLNTTEKECVTCRQIKPVSEFKQWEVEGMYTKHNRYDKTCNACKVIPIPTAIAEKKCSLCGVVKPQKEFSRCKTSLSGLQSKCKECVRVSTKKNLEINYAHFYYPVNDF